MPLINLQLKNYLTDVCDFDVEIIMNDKNDVYFYIIKDGVYSSLSGGSGFEKTISALALRFVLGNISSLPKMQFLVVDEIFGRVARDNYEKVKLDEKNGGTKNQDWNVQFIRKFAHFTR